MVPVRRHYVPVLLSKSTNTLPPFHTVSRQRWDISKFWSNSPWRRPWELRLALPKEVEHWSLTTLREKLVKIGAKVVSHGRYVTFQTAEVAVPRELFRKILSLIDDLRRRPVPA